MADREEFIDAEEQQVTDLSNSEVVTKYRTAADIANGALATVLKAAVAGAKVVDLCDLGDDYITKNAANFYKKGQVQKGVAFPTCVSVNSTVCHNSPLPEDDYALKEGDVVKIDLGAHFDGFAAVVAHTVVLTNEPITGKQADVLAACEVAAQAAIRLIKPGRTNTEVTDTLAKIAETFHVNTCEGILSHQLGKEILDGEKVILGKVTPEHKVAEFAFEENEVYAMDIVFTSGDGKLRESGQKTTVFKRVANQNYNLKLKAARSAFQEISTRFGHMAFSVRSLSDTKQRLGMVECIKHDLLQPFPVLCEKAGEVLAHTKFTVLILPSGTTARITQPPQGSQQNFTSEFKVEDVQLQQLLATSASATASKKKKKNKGKKKEATSEETKTEEKK